jgi:hypothetical protein
MITLLKLDRSSMVAAALLNTTILPPGFKIALLFQATVLLVQAKIDNPAEFTMQLEFIVKIFMSMLAEEYF